MFPEITRRNGAKSYIATVCPGNTSMIWRFMKDAPRLEVNTASMEFEVSYGYHESALLQFLLSLYTQCKALAFTSSHAKADRQ